MQRKDHDLLIEVATTVRQLRDDLPHNYVTKAVLDSRISETELSRRSEIQNVEDSLSRLRDEVMEHHAQTSGADHGAVEERRRQEREDREAERKRSDIRALVGLLIAVAAIVVSLLVGLRNTDLDSPAARYPSCKDVSTGQVCITTK